jgi:hypothetical protein
MKVGLFLIFTSSFVLSVFAQFENEFSRPEGTYQDLGNPIRGGSMLTEIDFHTRINIMESVAIILADAQGRIKGCKLLPEFDPQITFYMLHCQRAVVSVAFYARASPGSRIFTDDGASGHRPYNHTDPPSVDLPDYAKVSRLANLYACPPRAYVVNRMTCTRYHFLVQRSGDDEASLQALGASDEFGAKMNPEFDVKKFKYNVTVNMDSRFKISAMSAQASGTVCIEYDGEDTTGNHGGLGWQNGCRNQGGGARSSTWDLEVKATGYFKYKVCARAAAGSAHTCYYITVEVIPPYGARLKALQVRNFTDEVTPAFDPDFEVYSLLIPVAVSEVHVEIVAEDSESAIRCLIDNVDVTHGAEVPRGSFNALVVMHNNSGAKFGETPRWTRTVQIIVKSSDGRMMSTYALNIKHDVSSFDMLDDLIIGDETPCKLDPPFQPNITEYACTWWWRNLSAPSWKEIQEFRYGAVTPIIGEKCTQCKILAPDPEEQEELQLSYHAQEEERFRWPSRRKWTRKFLYGEFHRVPFQVISADQFDFKTYYVTFTRDCQWWMKTAFTRWLSKTATSLALILAASSGVANVMALAKQVQFMSLTCEIQGVPEVYEQFANSLKAFNFDAFGWIPFDKLGLPTMKDLKSLKKQWIVKVEEATGINDGTLLIQYCFTRNWKKEDILYAHAILELDPLRGRAMEMHLNRMKEMAAEKKAKADEQRIEMKSAQAAGDDSVPIKRRRLWQEEFLAWREEADAEGDRDGELQISGVPHQPVLRGASSDVSNFSQADLASTHDAQARSEFAVAPVRRLGDGAENDAEYFEGKLDFSDYEYEKLVDIVLETPPFQHLPRRADKEKFLRHKWGNISCDAPQIVVIDNSLWTIHQLFEFRKLLKTTTGTFIILSTGILFFGTLYGLFFFFTMKGRQTRWRLLEPGPMLLFLADYSLMAFAKSASKVAFRHRPFYIFSFEPSHSQVTLVCIVGFVCLPWGFRLSKECST